MSTYYASPLVSSPLSMYCIRVLFSFHVYITSGMLSILGEQNNPRLLEVEVAFIYTYTCCCKSTEAGCEPCSCDKAQCAYIGAVKLHRLA